ncbi:uncharacterized protein si:ch211-197l9.2 isoform X2 [Syngnathoides biaculeatus]|uniref:uncharacterized protein si:ch211-197l9.2 isoform X2 n=1 Tax=Syngnathoides biaculeatus TaxID=300417 RepID=UPI002ADD836D|nr:uncharacterized protein si:ch211-197l9.2 isoform X2 [Syngnathoides biaculeatus]
MGREEMEREKDGNVKSAPRSQKSSSRFSQQGTVQRRKREATWKESPSGGQPRGTPAGHRGSGKDGRATGRRPGGSPVAACQRSSGAQRKLSDASNTSEDLSRDSGCLSGKPSSDSSSEISDCPWEGNKRDSPVSDNELSWSDAGACRRPPRGGKDDAEERSRAAGNARSPLPDAAGGGLAVLNSSEAFMELVMAETADDLLREVEDLRSENEYLKDEVDELRCEMSEMRDVFQEEETHQLQDLRQLLERANKSCRILQYRLRKAERRSIRVAQTGLVDGELVRTLEHDIKVAKSVSLRLYNELEAVQKKNGQLDWENEMLREKIQEMEVVRHVLEAELEKAREHFLKRRSSRSAAGKTERRLSQQIEDDGDLKCQLHFAKEELAVMCKKLTKLVSESDATHEQLARYRAAYGDVDASRPPEGGQKSAYAREAEVKVHLKLLEEEAMLLSRRIVELETENRGLRAEIHDLRERDGGGGGEEEEEEEEEKNRLSPSALGKDRKERGPTPKTTSSAHDQRATVETEGQLPSCHVTREGPVGGEREPSDGVGNESPDRTPEGLTGTDHATLAALRDHCCLLTSAVQMVTSPPKNGLVASPSGALVPGPLKEPLEVLQAVLRAFLVRMEVLLGGKNSPRQEGQVWGSCLFSADRDTTQQECARVDADEPAKQTSEWDPRMKLSMQILWVLHQWCQDSIPEGKEAKDKRLSVLRGLLQRVGAELKEETLDGRTVGVRNEAAECAVRGVVTDERHPDADRICNSIRMKLNRQLAPHEHRRKNWCYLSQKAALVDQEARGKTWDHLIMPFSFPDLDFEQMSVERSHTAPEKSALRIYYSPPSKRRVHLAQLKQSPESDRESVETQSPWCTPPTSFSTLCVGSSANLSDDMKEMAASCAGLQVGRTRSEGRGVGVTCSATQTHIRPLMVSVGLQTEGPQGPVTARNSPSRAVNSSLISSHSRCVSTSLDRLTSRTEKSRLSASSPKLYRSQSASGASSNLTSSSAANARHRTLWNHQSHPGPTGHRSSAGPNLSPLHSEPLGQNLNPQSKSAGGLVTEFLRRVSGRAERPVPGSAQKTNGGLERAPVRASSSSLPRSDSVTRIVNHRFMKQREEVGRPPDEEKRRRSGNNAAACSLRSAVAEDGSYDCSSSSTLTFCFARPFRSTPRQTSNQSKVARRPTAESDGE